MSDHLFDWEILPERLTPHFLKALLKWQSEGARAVDIKISHTFSKDNRKMVIFCYDHSVFEGRHVSRISEIPTTRQLMQMKKESIEKERAELQKKMDKLEEKS